MSAVRSRRRRALAALAGLLAALLVVATSTLLYAGDRRSRGSTSEALTALPVGWSTLPAPPEVRIRSATGWTGKELLVWGGYVFTGFGDEIPKADGFVFDAEKQAWAELPGSPLSARVDPASAWSGSELLVWGGWGDRNRFFDDGAAYDPVTGKWRVLPEAPISARAPISVWTGEELLVWGTAVRVSERPRDGAAYDPRTDSWRVLAEAPIELTDATAVWTGREMFAFGAALHGGNLAETKTAIGAAYDPESGTWRTLPPSQLSPQASTAAWTGQELIAWDYLHRTAAYHPGRDSWRRLPSVPLPSGECSPQSVAVGSHVFGDYCGLMAIYAPAEDRWRDVSQTPFAGWGFVVVAADPVVLLLGRSAETGKQQMVAYRPST